MIPLASSPQRIFFSCINVDITSENVLRGSRGAGSGKSQGAGFAIFLADPLEATDAKFTGVFFFETSGASDNELGTSDGLGIAGVLAAAT
ncbi:hypothetical protein N9030_00655, partial [bacterium]|nr:hypothetical protein [bacterium]